MLPPHNKKLLILSIIIFLALLYNIYSIRNPIAVYCEYGGGIYYINGTGSYCIINNTYFDALQYFENDVPPEYSLCARYGLIYVNSSYCKYPNGTLISPYTLIPPSAYQDLIIPEGNRTACDSLLNCSNTPWYYPPCSNQIYPCFDPPYIPPSYLVNNESYQSVLNVYQIEYQCGYCPENLSFEGDWFRCPYNYSLNQLYQEFLQQCPPPNIVYISCTGVFECINQTEVNLTNNTQQLIYPQPNVSNSSNNINLILPAAIVIIIVIIGLFILLYYLK
jgi:hypothetical protein